MKNIAYAVALSTFTSSVLAAPAPEPAAGSAATSTISLFEELTATTTPTDVAQASSLLSSIVLDAQPTSSLDFAELLVENGLTSESASDLVSELTGQGSAGNSFNNVNPSPSKSVYPKSKCDAPYSVSEAVLRSAIHIPSTFTYGKKAPVILFPGTGSTGYLTFIGNFIPLLTNVSYADPVWVNVPGYLYADAQQNAEFAAYAINYIAALTCQNVSVIAWSQGNIDSQWAYKYWPSTNGVTSNHIAISADYHGTTTETPTNTTIPSTEPALLQQAYDSNFILTLRSNNGDSAYVPTTSLYSAFYDEVVQPQEGTNASAYILDERGVGVTNNEVQAVCYGTPGGSFYTHEGMLYNPLSFALAKDAIVNGGPGQPSRVDLATVCAQYLTTGLTLEDFQLTENTIPVAVLEGELYEPKVATEPAISAYATATTTCKAAAATGTCKASQKKA